LRAGDPVFACPNGLIYHGPLDKMVDKQIAVFGEANIKLTETLKATLGLRYSKLDYTGSVYETGPFLATTIQTESSASEKPITPKVVLSWQPDATSSCMRAPRRASARVVSMSASAASAMAISSRLDCPRTGLHHERAPGAGPVLVRSPVELRDRRQEHVSQSPSAAELELFYIDWKDIQQNVYLPSCGEQFTGNLGKVQSRGGDIEVLYRPVRRCCWT